MLIHPSVGVQRLRKVQELANAKHGKNGVVAYYVMTSGPTHAKTVGFFTEHNFFGLDPKNIMFFQQVSAF